MKTVLLTSAVACTLVASPALGQSLEERAAALRSAASNRSSNLNSRPALLGALLYTDVSVDFDETSTRDALRYISDQLGVPMIARYNDSPTGLGLDPEQPITLRLQNMPALSVLEMTLEQAGAFDPATWQLRNGFIEVGTKEALSTPAAQETRIYPIRDLLFEPPYFDNAPDFSLNDAIRQGGGGGRGGGGGGGGFGGGGGGGGFGGGGGGSGGGGGGGGFLGDPGEDPERLTEEERAERLREIIESFVEPEAWGLNANIEFYQGTFIIRAPDFIHRQLGGYPFAPRAPRRVSVNERRYVTFTAPVSIVDNVQFRTQTVTGSAGGGGVNP